MLSGHSSLASASTQCTYIRTALSAIPIPSADQSTPPSPWLLIHLPMSAGLLIGGHVSAGSAFEEELISGKRWLWGGGLGLGMFCMWIIAQLYRDDDDRGILVLGKQLRLLPRLLASLIYVLLPLASEESLSPTALISTGAGISGFVVIWEMLTGLDIGCGCFWRAGGAGRKILIRSLILGREGRWLRPRIHRWRTGTRKPHWKGEEGY